MPTIDDDFPEYTVRELAADRAIHFVGVPAGLLTAVWLVASVADHGSLRQVVAACLYAVGLVAMLGASAAYNLTSPGYRKTRLRRLDHAAIFIMIAGSYTPFALCALPSHLGLPLFAAAWAVAALGTALKLRFGSRYGAAFIALYLVHGWMAVPILGPVIAALSFTSFALLIGGGLVYSVGVLFHTQDDWPFNNPIWHVLVLIAAGLQLGAMLPVLGI